MSPPDLNPALVARLAELEARTELVETLTQAADAELRALLLPLFIDVRELRARLLDGPAQDTAALTARHQALSARLLETSARVTTLEFDFSAFRREASRHFEAIAEALREARATALERAEASSAQGETLRTLVEEVLALLRLERR